MNTKSMKKSKWMRLAGKLLIVAMLTISISSQASARILFQDDDFHDIPSEGIIINSDDGGDEDVTLQLGNDGTDATMTFDDGTGDVTLATDGGDFSFSDDNLSGTGGLNFSGVINFSNASTFFVRQSSSVPANCTEGELYYNSTSNTTYMCTATDTWTAFSTGTQDFEGVYGADTDKTLTTSNGAFTIDTGTNDFIVDSNDWTVDASGNLTANDITSNGTFDANGVVTIGDGGDTVAIDSSAWDISSTGVASGFTGITSTGVIDFSGATRFAIHSGGSNPATCTEGDLFYNTTADTLYVCTATDTWSSSADGGDADTLDTLDSTQFLRSDASDNYTSGTLTMDAGTTLTVNGILDANGVITLGDGGDSITVDSSTWDISAAGAASGFTTIDASGNITTSAGDFIIGTTGLTETTSATDSGAYLIGAFDEFDNSTSTNVQDVLDDFDALIGSNAPNVDEMTFEPEYPDVVVYQDGTDNRGKLIADYDNTNRHQYYRWDTNRTTAQDVDLRFRYELPADFVATGNMTIDYRTATANTSDNSVAVTVRDDTANTDCHVDAATANAGWGTITITSAEIDGGCTLTAGDTVEVIMKLTANDTNTGYADVGTLTFDYTN